MPTQTVSVEIVIDGDSYLATDEFKCVSDRYYLAAELTATIITSEPTRKFTEGEDKVVAYISGEPVFVGTLQDVSNVDSLSNEITAFNVVYKLTQNTIDQSFKNATLTHIAETVLKTAGVESYTVNLPNESVSTEYTDVKCARVLDKITTVGDAVWRATISTSGNELKEFVHVRTDPNPELFQLGNENPSGQPRGVLETTAGKKTPPYQSVRVIGISPSSQSGHGQQSENLVSSSPLVAQVGEGKPRYRFKSDEIKTARMAAQAAKQLHKEFQRQQKGGWVKTTGFTGAHPFDVIQMPEFMGGERYIISELEHVIDNDEGFTTKITCGGLVDSGVN